MANNQGIAEFLVQYMPDGVQPTRHQYPDGSDLYHVDVSSVRDNINGLRNKLAEELNESATERSKSEVQDKIDFLDQNKVQIDNSLETIVRENFAVEYGETNQLEASKPQDPPKQVTMVEPWDTVNGTHRVEEYQERLSDARGWEVMRDTLENSGADVTVVDSTDIDGNEDIWIRDPAVSINGVNYMSTEDKVPSRKRDTFESAKDHLEANGEKIDRVDAEIEGGNILVDPENGVILYGTNSRQEHAHDRMAESTNKLDEVRQDLANNLPPEIMDRIPEDLAKLVTETTLKNRNRDIPWQEKLEAYDAAEQETLEAIPEDYIIQSGKYEGVSARRVLGNVLNDVYSDVDAIAYHTDKLNEQANNLQDATGIPVVPIDGINKEQYHTDTYAALIQHEGGTTLMIDPSAVSPDTMDRLRDVYGENIIEMNADDTQGLASNGVQVGDDFITNHMSEETRGRLSELGVKVVTPIDVGSQHDFKFGPDAESGIHCLTREEHTVAVPEQIKDGKKTPLEAETSTVQAQEKTDEANSKTEESDEKDQVSNSVETPKDDRNPDAEALAALNERSAAMAKAETSPQAEQPATAAAKTEIAQQQDIPKGMEGMSPEALASAKGIAPDAFPQGATIVATGETSPNFKSGDDLVPNSPQPATPSLQDPQKAEENTQELASNTEQTKPGVQSPTDINQDQKQTQEPSLDRFA